MTAIRLAIEDDSETRDNITIHIYSLTVVLILINMKLDLNTIPMDIRNVASRLTEMPSINWIPAHTGILGNKKADQAAKSGLQMDRIHTTANAITFSVQTRMKKHLTRHTMSMHSMTHHNKQRATDDHTRLTAQ